MATMTSQVTSTARIYVVSVVVPSLDPIADPIDYISQPARYQEALAKAGLPEDLVFLSATLKTVITIGDIYEYHLELGFDAAPVFATGHFHDHKTVFLPLRESYRDGPTIDLDPTLGPVRITSPDDTTDFFQVQKGSDDLFLIRANGTVRVGTNIEMYPDNQFDIGTPDGGAILRRPRDVRIGRNLYVGGAGEFVEEAQARNFQFSPQAFNPDNDPFGRHIYWNSVDNELHQWDGMTDSVIGGGGGGSNPHLGTYNCPTTVNLLDVVKKAGSDAVDKASAATTDRVVGIVVAKPFPTIATVQLLGEVGGFSGTLVPDAMYYASTTPGAITNNLGTLGAGTTRHLVGVAKSSNILLVRFEVPITI